MRRRQSQDYNAPGSPFGQRPQPTGYNSPTSAHQFSPNPNHALLSPPQHSSPHVQQQRPAPQQHQQSYQPQVSHDPYSDDGGLYGYYAGEDDTHSTHSHTALNMPINEKDYYSQTPPVPAVPSHFAPAPGAPSYPPPPSPHLSPHMPPFSPGYAPPSPSLAGYWAGGFQPGGFYEQQSSYYQTARQDVMKRREKKQIQLTDGHLILDLKVPRSIQQLSVYRGEDLNKESGFVRYTAVTDDPDDFTRSRYRLRQTLYNRQTELFICCTMYNEDEHLFARTFTSVIKNIQHLQSRTKSKTWGADAWKKVVVCVVSDGRSKINSRTLKMLGLYGAYQDGVQKDTVEGKDVQAHVWEYTTQVVVDDKGNVSGGISPIQILFCLKEQNKKKLNSHRWAFNAFCPQLRPNVCVLLDVGTKPSGDSIYHLWKAFDKHRHVGGACGEITVDLGRGCGNLINPLVAAQNFEYKMSNILDKSLESTFGFVSVLPGAFSAYRYKALLGKPLDEYFKGENMHAPGAIVSLGESNKYLAEDRILCFELIAKRNEAWVLRYVKSAKASTDVPDSVAEFISQRRRWMNGAFFAALYSTTRYYRLWTSGQSFFRKLWMSLLFLYNAIQIFFSFVGLSSFYLAFFFLCTSAVNSERDPFGGAGDDVISIANNVYIATLAITIVCALGNKPAGSRVWYILVMLVFAILFCIAMYCTVWTIYWAVPHTTEGWSDVSALFDNSAFRNIVIAVAATYLLYIVSSILHYDPWHVITCFAQYMLFLPSYVSVLTIYSFANLHDLGWGTKGDTTVKDLGHAKKTKDADGKEVLEVALPTKDDDINDLWIAMRKEISTPPAEVKQKRSADQKQQDHYANIRTNTLLAYLGTNMAIVVFFTSTLWTNWVSARTGENINLYQVAIFWAVAGLSAFRFFGSTMYLILRLFGH
ncbi:hypothetical protein JCM6882_000915 [Rhodosporidiobolus microsporus]